MLDDQVKKGKTRKFILICKGASIKGLMVFKKGPFGPRVAKARKNGIRGEAYCGLATGKGVNLTLQLAGTPEVSAAMNSEGRVYEDVPCKIAKLRAFLAEEAELRFKPEFQIVMDVAAVHSVDDEPGEETDPGGTEPEASAEQASQASEQEGEPSSDPTQMAKLVEALKRLKSPLEAAVAAHPDRKTELVGRMTQIAGEIKARAAEPARTHIVELGGLLKELAAAPPSAGPQEGGEAASVDADQQSSEADGRAAFMQRVKQLKPQIQEAVARGGETGDAIRARLSEAKTLAQADRYSEANGSLDELEQLLATPTGSEGSIVDFAKARLEWVAAKQNVEGQLHGLRTAVLAEFDDEEALESVEKLDRVLARFNEGLTDSLDDLYNAEADRKSDVARKALAIAASYRGYVESDDLVAHVDENPFMPTSVRDTLTTPLAGIESRLQATL